MPSRKLFVRRFPAHLSDQVQASPQHGLQSSMCKPAGSMNCTAVHSQRLTTLHMTQDIELAFGAIGAVTKVSLVDHGDSCNEPAALVTMDSAALAATAVAAYDHTQTGQAYLVRYKHPRNNIRAKLVEDLRVAGVSAALLSSYDDYI